MATWEKKIRSGGGKDLEAGETLVGGILLNPHGTTGKMVARGIGGAVGAAIATRVGNDEGFDGAGADGGGIAQQLPDERIWIGLTDRRLLVWGHSTLSGKPKGLRLALPSDDLVGVELDRLKASYTTVLRFRDGSAARYEAPKLMNDPEAFAATVNEG